MVPLTSAQEASLISMLQGKVKSGAESDCDALADYVDDVAANLSGSGGPAQLVASLALLTPNQFPVYLIPGISRNSAYVPLNPNQSPSGFQTQFQDQLPNADQAHHFAAFFQLGFAYGAAVAGTAATWWEKLEGTSGNTGDINLGMAASLIGSYVKSGVLPIDQVGQTIRETICNK